MSPRPGEEVTVPDTEVRPGESDPDSLKRKAIELILLRLNSPHDARYSDSLGKIKAEFSENDANYVADLVALEGPVERYKIAVSAQFSSDLGAGENWLRLAEESLDEIRGLPGLGVATHTADYIIHALEDWKVALQRAHLQAEGK